MLPSSPQAGPDDGVARAGAASEPHGELRGTGEPRSELRSTGEPHGERRSTAEPRGELRGPGEPHGEPRHSGERHPEPREREIGGSRSVSEPRVVCTLPTYNESQNILPLARELLALASDLHVLVVDDHSPDGTWKIVADAARNEPRLHLLDRTSDRGRGRAGRDGFVTALKMGASVVIEMDADFSHQPRYVPQLIDRLETGGDSVGLVLGSRAVAGGLDADRGITRRLITKAANLYIRVLLGVPVRDCNSGFRCWRRETLERIHVEDTFSPGPAIVQELLFKTARARIGIAEVPIEFANRLHGHSTLTVRTLLSGYTAVLKLRWMSLCGKL